MRGFVLNSDGWLQREEGVTLIVIDASGWLEFFADRPQMHQTGTIRQMTNSLRPVPRASERHIVSWPVTIDEAASFRLG